MTARILLFTVAVSLSLHAQAPESGSAPAAPSDVRATPQGSVFGFLEAARQGDYRRASSFLDVRRHSGDSADLARQFKEILDRKLSQDPGLLSALPEGDLTDGLDPNLELLGTVTSGDRKVELVLERVSIQEGLPLWLVSSGTVGRIPSLHKELGDTWLEKRLPAWLRVEGPLDSALWQWLALLALTAISFILAAIIARILVQALRPLVRRTPTEMDDELVASMVNPLRLLMALAVYRAGLVWIVPSVLMRTYLARTLTALAYLAFAWLALRFIDVIATKVVASMTGRHRASASSIVPLLRRTAKVGVVLIAVLATLASWGYNTTALLAGLGVGGLAVALAAQKTIENLFGGVAITTDKPVLIGDFCRYGDRFGVVEDIGLRSTRIRTLDRTLVTVPNAQFSSMELENYGKRDKIFFHPILHLRLDTSPDQVRTLIAAFRGILLNNPKIDPSPARVRLIRIGDYSLDIEIFAYVLTTQFDEFLVVQEELLLEIMDAISNAGTGLALPATMNMVTRDRLRTRREEPQRVVSPTDSNGA